MLFRFFDPSDCNCFLLLFLFFSFDDSGTFAACKLLFLFMISLNGARLTAFVQEYRCGYNFFFVKNVFLCVCFCIHSFIYSLTQRRLFPIQIDFSFFNFVFSSDIKRNGTRGDCVDAFGQQIRFGENQAECFD